MAKQKVVIKISMIDMKKRCKAMQCAAGLIGVLSLSVDGDNMTIVGDGIDAAKLTMLLRKKLGFAELIKLTDVVEENMENTKPAKLQEFLRTKEMDELLEADEAVDLGSS